MRIKFFTFSMLFMQTSDITYFMFIAYAQVIQKNKDPKWSLFFCITVPLFKKSIRWLSANFLPELQVKPLSVRGFFHRSDCRRYRISPRHCKRAHLAASALAYVNRERSGAGAAGRGQC